MSTQGKIDYGKKQKITYNDLFKNKSKLIFKLIINFVRARNIDLHDSEIDDIHQEVALKIYKNDYLSRYNSQKSSFVTWLNIICRTTTIDYYRNKLRWMESILARDEDPDAVEFHVPGFALPMGVLTRRQEEVVTLFFRDGLIAGEIAERLDITSRTVRSTKFQALERLRSHYGSAAPIPPAPGEPRRNAS